MGVVALAGGLVVMRLGWGCLTAQPAALRADPGTAGSWRKGVGANAFNPFMYLFWATVGAPTVLAAFRQSLLAAAGFGLARLLRLPAGLHGRAGLAVGALHPVSLRPGLRVDHARCSGCCSGWPRPGSSGRAWSSARGLPHALGAG